MKRILTLALAAMMIVAFAIPAFAAPKIEIVGGTVNLTTSFNAGTPWGTQTAFPQLYSLKFKLSADNFTFSGKTLYNTGVAGDPTLPSDDIALDDYSFSLALPYVAVSASYNDYYAQAYGIHMGREVRVASDDKFAELAGFSWAAYLNDDSDLGAFGSMHAELSVPVGNFTGTLKYAHEGIDFGYLNAKYNFSDDLYVDAYVAKEIDAATDNFYFNAMVGFPIVEGWSGTFFAQYGMTGATTDTDFLNIWAYENAWTGNTFEAAIDTRYNNEATNAQVMVDYAAAADFTTNGLFSVYAEYVSNGNVSYGSTTQRTTNYADTYWNTNGYFNWVRANSGNEFAARLYGTVDLTGAFYLKGYGMFAPDVVPMVITAIGEYTDAANWYAKNWVGFRINPDIHFALYDRYVVTAGVGTFDLDTALVYSKDSVTMKATGSNLLTTWGASLYLGISF